MGDVDSVPHGNKPETVYELLEAVAQHIEVEPQRYFQGSWALSVDEARREYGFELNPPCGTVCCRAGWIVALHDGIVSVDELKKLDLTVGIEHRAMEVIGVDPADEGEADDSLYLSTDALFSADAMRDEAAVPWDDVPTPGTVEYARMGAAGVRAFMKAHADHLKARRLADVPPLES